MADNVDTASVKSWLLAGGDIYLLESLGWFLLILGLFLVVLELLNIQVPYGRYSNNEGWISSLLLTSRIKVPARVGWFFMEMPSFVIPLYLILNVGGQHVGEMNPNIMILGMFVLHYFNRLVFSNKACDQRLVLKGVTFFYRG